MIFKMRIAGNIPNRGTVVVVGVYGDEDHSILLRNRGAPSRLVLIPPQARQGRAGGIHGEVRRHCDGRKSGKHQCNQQATQTACDASKSAMQWVVERPSHLWHRELLVMFKGNASFLVRPVEHRAFIHAHCDWLLSLSSLLRAKYAIKKVSCASRKAVVQVFFFA